MEPFWEKAHVNSVAVDKPRNDLDQPEVKKVIRACGGCALQTLDYRLCEASLASCSGHVTILHLARRRGIFPQSALDCALQCK